MLNILFTNVITSVSIKIYEQGVNVGSERKRWFKKIEWY